MLDLFCGAGGLASGFSDAGFDVTGVDVLPVVLDIFRDNKLGVAKIANLGEHIQNGGYSVIIGGPPCRPWSSVNTRKRGTQHENFPLLARFGEHVLANHPKSFLLENVPPSRTEVDRLGARLITHGYSVQTRILSYADYGAATTRRRLFMFGSRIVDATRFFEELEKLSSAEKTVRDAIGYLEHTECGSVPDHVYPNFQTIERYIPYYETGKFGWVMLSWRRPAPSFGNAR